MSGHCVSVIFCILRKALKKHDVSISLVMYIPSHMHIPRDIGLKSRFPLEHPEKINGFKNEKGIHGNREYENKSSMLSNLKCSNHKNLMYS